MNKKLPTFIIAFIIIFSSFLLTTMAYAEPIVPPCNTGEIIPATGSGKDLVSAHFAETCDFDKVMQLINRGINFLLFVIATPLVAIIVCYVGFLFLTSGGNPERLTKAKSILKNVIFGYIIALAAWLIVNTIFSALGVNDPCLNWLGKVIPDCLVSPK